MDDKDDKPKTGLRSLPINVWVVTATSFLTDVSSEMTAWPRPPPA